MRRRRTRRSSRTWLSITKASHWAFIDQISTRRKFPRIILSTQGFAFPVARLKLQLLMRQRSRAWRQLRPSETYFSSPLANQLKIRNTQSPRAVSVTKNLRKPISMKPSYTPCLKECTTRAASSNSLTSMWSTLKGKWNRLRNLTSILTYIQERASN